MISSIYYRLHAACGDCHSFLCCALYACPSSRLACGSPIKLASYIMDAVGMTPSFPWFSLVVETCTGGSLDFVLFSEFSIYISMHSHYNKSEQETSAWSFSNCQSCCSLKYFLSLLFTNIRKHLK